MFFRTLATDEQQASSTATPPPAPARSANLEARRRISDELMSRISTTALDQMSEQEVHEHLRPEVAAISDELSLALTEEEQAAITEEVVDDIFGVGPLQPLLEDGSVTDIMVNGPNHVFVERRGQGRVLSGITFRSAQHLESAAARIARDVGRKVDESNPMVDARLADGSRVNIIFPPLALDGASISIRRFPDRALTLGELVDGGAMSSDMARFLELAAAARLTILVSGGTSSGKTTLLNALTPNIDRDERVITIEDTAELRVQVDNLVRLETRNATSEGGKAISQTDLVRNALRMNPDRILIGEVRGAEAFDFLQAANTGHDGSLGTLHANTPRDALSRLENMVLMAGFDLPARAIRSQIASAVDIVVQVSKMRDGTRRITHISEVVGQEEEVIKMQDLFTFRTDAVAADKIHGDFVASNAQPACLEKFRGIGAESEVTSLFR